MQMSLDYLIEFGMGEMPTAKALRDRLAQPEPEPVAWHEPGAYGNVTTHKDWALANGWEPLYTAPPRREWVGLTDEEIWETEPYKMAVTDQETRWLYRFAKTIEAKLKEKNA
jgi:hypothetical protein